MLAQSVITECSSIVRGIGINYSGAV